MITRKVLSAIVVIFFALSAADIARAQSLEIKFWPQDKIYTYEITPWLHDIVLQNVAIINRSEKPVTLDKLQMTVLRKGEPIQDRVILFSDLGQNLKSFQAKYKAGDLRIWDAEYHLTDFFGKATLAESARLAADEGVTVRDLYFAYNDQADTLQVTAYGKSEDGLAIKASAELPLDRYESKKSLSLPLVGTWQVANGPFPTVSHRWVIHQEFGYDFWKVDADGLDCKGACARYEDYYSYGQDVIAPADGTVVSLNTDGEDAPLINDRLIKDQAEFLKRLFAVRDALFQKGYAALGGNQVVIDHGNGEYSLFAHLKKGSIRVKKGDKVKRGDLLALVGNTGLSNVPHLHYELGTAPELPGRRGLPLRLIINDEKEARTLSLGEFVRNGAVSKP